MNLEEEEATTTFPAIRTRHNQQQSVRKSEAKHVRKFICHRGQTDASSREIASSCFGWHKMPKTTKISSFEDAANFFGIGNIYKMNVSLSSWD